MVRDGFGATETGTDTVLKKLYNAAFLIGFFP